MRLSSSGTIEVEGARLHYTVGGRGAVPLVVVPGGPGFGCGYLRRELDAVLSDACRLVFHDPRGCGHSTGAADPSRLTVEQFAEDLDRVREAAGLERVNVLGHSFGGLVALHHAIAYPARADRLILVDSDPASHRRWSRFRAVIEARRSAEESRELEAIQADPGWQLRPEPAERYFRVYMRPYFGKPELAERLRFDFDEVVLRNLSVTAGRVRANLADWDIGDRLPGISARTLLICGDSGIFDPDDHEAIRRRIPGARRVVIEGAGHFPYMEAPRRFAAAVREFLGLDG